jgi:hypothetical protein
MANPNNQVAFERLYTSLLDDIVNRIPRQDDGSLRKPYEVTKFHKSGELLAAWAINETTALAAIALGERAMGQVTLFRIGENDRPFYEVTLNSGLRAYQRRGITALRVGSVINRYPAEDDVAGASRQTDFSPYANPDIVDLHVLDIDHILPKPSFAIANANEVFGGLGLGTMTTTPEWEYGPETFAKGVGPIMWNV